tara:strand:- start:1461 stop:1988 length:528 start_codon:yes stop_codon:yes gene_type:complete
MLLRPFGPVIHKGNLPEKYRQVLLNAAFDCKDDASAILVGQIEDQLYIYPEAGWMTPFEYGVRELLGTNAVPAMDIQPVWVNFQQAGDWQPVHNHDGDFSLVAFLDVPQGIYDEPDIAGSLFFTYGEKQEWSNNIFGPHKPEKGDFYIFPAWLNHYVYPFRSSGTRISLSGNIFL